jgi:NhaP-type Na+/H+ or K+/H+ antiporter
MEMKALETLNLAVVLGVGSYTLARWLGVPAILFYLVAGMACGPAGLDILHLEAFGEGLLTFVEVAVAIILFEGGLSLSSRGFQRSPSAISRMLLLTIPLTAVGGTVLARFALGLSWDMAVVFGTIIVVTGPTVIGPLLESVNLKHHVETLLHWESIWGDVSGALLSALALQFIALRSLPDLEGFGLTFVETMFAGLSVGIAAGYLLHRVVLRWTGSLNDRGLPGIIAFAAVMGIFYGANSLMPAAGPLAVAVTGFMLSHEKTPHLQSIREFEDQLSVLLISTLFVLLSAYIDPRVVLDNWLPIVLTAGALIVLVRPAAVGLALAGSCPAWKERLYIGAMGPRGIVALAAASYVAMSIPGRGDETSLLLAATFFCILASGALTTLLGKPLASLLQVREPASRSGMLLVGANELSMELARFAQQYVAVSFVDTNQKTCGLLRDENLPNVCADVLDDDLYERANAEGFRRLLALTTYDALNQLVCQKAALFMGGDRVFSVRGEAREKSLMAEPLYRAQYAFAPDFQLGDALETLRGGRARLELVEDYDPSDDSRPLLRVTADQGLEVVRGRDGLNAGDTAFCLVPGPPAEHPQDSREQGEAA